MTKIEVTDSSEKKPVKKAKKAKKILVEKVDTNASKKTTKKAMGKVAVKATAKKSKKSRNTKSTDIKKSAKAPKVIKVSDSKDEKAEEKKAEKAISSTATHNLLQKSTTLSRKYVAPPVHQPTEAPDDTVSVKVADSQAEPAAVSAAEKPAEAKVETATTKAEEPKETKVETIAASAEAPKEAKTEATTANAAEPKEISKAEPKEIKVETAPANTTEAEKAEVKATVSAEKTETPATIEKVTPVVSEKENSRAAKKAAARAAKLARKQARATMPTMPKTSSRAKLDDRTLKSAMKNVASMDEPQEMHGKFRKKKKGGRILLALLCSGATVGALVAFVHFNMPDISVKVAAMQIGIEASYPNIIPRGYSLNNVSSNKDGEITMNFENSEGYKFTLSEEKSTWDSAALLNNYVKKAMSKDYTTMREQGITIYSDGGESVWVNGGLLFTVKSTGKWLSKEQIRNLATSS